MSIKSLVPLALLAAAAGTALAQTAPAQPAPAAQDPADPGVLVLSRFAGAAEQMRDALLVNPHDTEGTAAAIRRALEMPLEERQQRHAALMECLRREDVHWWCRAFLDALAESPQADLALAA